MKSTRKSVAKINLDQDTFQAPPVSAMKDLKRVWKTISHSELRLFFIVVFLLTMTPSLASTYNFYYTVELKFNLITMSKISLVASIAYLLSVLSIMFIFKSIQFRKFYLSTALAINLLNLSALVIVLKKHQQLSVSATVFCYFLNSLLVFAHELNFLPLLAACTRLCPEDLEGTTYGLFTSIFSGGYYLGTIFASFLLYLFGISSKQYHNLYLVVIIQATYGLLVLGWLAFIAFPNADAIIKTRTLNSQPLKLRYDVGDSEDDETTKLSS